MRNVTMALFGTALAYGIAGSGVVLAQGGTSPSGTDGYRMPYEKSFWGYTGISALRARYKDVCLGNFSCDDRDNAFKLYAGGKIHEALGLEIGYVDLGEAKVAGSDVSARGINVSLTLGAPIGERSSIFAKLGTTYGRTRTEGGPPGFAQGDETGWGTSWGVGTAVGFTDNWQLRLDWDRTRFDFVRGDKDVDVIAVGMQYRF